MLEPKPIGDDGGEGGEGLKNPSDPAAAKKPDETDQAKIDDAEGPRTRNKAERAAVRRSGRRPLFARSSGCSAAPRSLAVRG